MISVILTLLTLHSGLGITFFNVNVNFLGPPLMQKFSFKGDLKNHAYYNNNHTCNMGITLNGVLTKLSKSLFKDWSNSSIASRASIQ